ncbi:hypothetical protein [Yimella sp. NH-Cas1]|uniref:hypothetical protein n=1 Tax=Yimella sp. NH-Cas1 TaxID=2917726 RepID=UPI001EFBBF11|nr:hypothetical protein [Yimella sp. NH-Cas1]MCG8654071.1 hypothetical protein [Yimella sp. NH-Cas1]
MKIGEPGDNATASEHFIDAPVTNSEIPSREGVVFEQSRSCSRCTAAHRTRVAGTCCHPALSVQARTASTPRLVGSLAVGEVASAFLVPETTLAQRITRAKGEIRTRDRNSQVQQDLQDLG